MSYAKQFFYNPKGFFQLRIYQSDDFFGAYILGCASFRIDQENLVSEIQIVDFLLFKNIKIVLFLNK
jgi:hypothetical protein